MQKRRISRKFLVSIVSAAGILLADLTGIQLSPEALAAIISVLGIWIFGEAAVDAADRLRK